jgi:hypothetical protein
MKRSVVRVDGVNGLVDSDVPLHEYSDTSHGATVLLMAGVHSGEYVPIPILRRFWDSHDQSCS